MEIRGQTDLKPMESKSQMKESLANTVKTSVIRVIKSVLLPQGESDVQKFC